MAILRAMNRRTAKRLFAIAGRLLLAVSLVFSTGPWASVLASVQAGDCQHMMSTAQHGSASTNYDCCPDARGDHGIPDCGKYASPCSGICNAVCGLAWSGPVPADWKSVV